MNTILFNTNLKKDRYEYKEIVNQVEIRNDLQIVDCRDSYSPSSIDITLNRSYLEKDAYIQHGVQINNFTTGYFWKDKTRQQYLNIPLPRPKTLYGIFPFNELREHLGVPFVAKRSLSFGGTGTFLISNQDDFARATYCNIFQEMIWDSFGKDLRLFVVGGELVGAMLRENIDPCDFRANAHIGGTGKKFPSNIEFIEISKTIYLQTGLDIIGIDLLFYKDTYMFCELNVNPGFEEFDKTFETCIAEKIISLCQMKLIEVSKGDTISQSNKNGG